MKMRMLALGAAVFASAACAAQTAPRPIDPSAEPRAPAIASDQWINSAPLAWDDLRGKVVMIEFWTFG